MVVDSAARTDFRNALVSFMRGEIRSRAFEDKVTPYQIARSINDESACEIARFLWGIYDEIVDHPISVTSPGWATLRRIVAFLRTDLRTKTTHDEPAWPFYDQEQWLQNEWLANELNLPQYDPALHARHVNRWWNRIPSSVGFAILCGILVTVLLVLFAL